MDKQLKAVFSLSAQELHDILTYGRLLSRNRFLHLDSVCKALNVSDILIGAGYIEGGYSSNVARRLLPERPYPACYMTLDLNRSNQSYITSNRLALEPQLWRQGEPLQFGTDLCGPTAILIGNVAIEDILKVEVDGLEFFREFLAIQQKESWLTRLRRRFTR